MATTRHILTTVGHLAELAEVHDQMQEAFQAFDENRLTPQELAGLYRTMADRFNLASEAWGNVSHAMFLAQVGVQQRLPSQIIESTSRRV